MRVISNWDAEHGNIKVGVVDESSRAKGQTGTIVGHNGKSMKYGRLYSVRLESGQVIAISGTHLKRLTE